MEYNKKGCVYFFRHIGLTPIKIGYSENESPIKRFEQFKTYAPFGAELIGFIRTENARTLEYELHLKYSGSRIKGEWFEIDIEEVKRCISFYSNIQDVEEMNNFQVSFANYINRKNENNTESSFFNLFSTNYELGYNKVILNQSEISELLKENKSQVRLFLIENRLKIKVHKVNGLSKKGYLLWKKN